MYEANNKIAGTKNKIGYTLSTSYESPIYRAVYKKIDSPKKDIKVKSL